MLGVQQRFFINFLNFEFKKFKNSDSQQPIFQLAQKHNIFIGGMRSKYPAGHDVRNTQIGQYNCCYRQNSITGFLHNWFIVVDSFVVPVILVLEPSPFNHTSGSHTLLIMYISCKIDILGMAQDDMMLLLNHTSGFSSSSYDVGFCKKSMYSPICHDAYYVRVKLTNHHERKLCDLVSIKTRKLSSPWVWFYHG